MSVIDDKTVELMAELSQLELTDEEKQMMVQHLTNMMKVAEPLTELDTEGVEPTSHGGSVDDVLRADDNRPSLPREQVLQNAPHAEDGYFRVPRIIE